MYYSFNPNNTGNKHTYTINIVYIIYFYDTVSLTKHYPDKKLTEEGQDDLKFHA